MINKVKKHFEDPDMPFLGPIVKAMKFWSFLYPKNSKRKYVAILLNILLFLFMITECIDVFQNRTNVNLMLTNVRFAMVGIVNNCKAFIMICFQDRIQRVMDYVTRADKTARKTVDNTSLKIINGYSRYSRFVLYSYWILTGLTVVAVIMQPIVKFMSSPMYRDAVSKGETEYDEIVRHWMPLDKNTVAGYLSAIVLQSYAVIFAGGLMGCFDTNAVVIMIFIRGELDLLRRCCSEIFDCDEKDEILRRMKDIRRRHSEVVEYAALFNSVLSPVLFLYTIVTSVMLCASVYQITIAPDFMQGFMVGEYAVFGVAQLFNYCWHANDVFYMSHEPMRGVYESAWWRRKVLRKEVILLTGQMDKRVIFTAGPFMNLSLPAFIHILKGAYSFYTLVSK